MDKNLLASILTGFSYSFSSNALSASNYKVPTGSFSLGSTGLNSLTVLGTFTGSGQICCIAEKIPVAGYTLYNTQIYVGVDRGNNQAMSNCTDITTNLVLVINGLDAITNYNVSCISTDNYPVWPSFSSISWFRATTIIIENSFTTSFSVKIMTSIGVLYLAY